MDTHAPLSPLGDPVSLGKVQVLLVPVHPITPGGGAQLTDAIYDFWSALIKRHQTLRGDEVRRPGPSSASTSHSHAHTRGASGESSRTRFIPTSTGTSISRATASNHVHLSYPRHPPARHLYPLSLLRLATFPLVVIGIAVDSGAAPPARGYSLSAGEDEGDLGQASTPTAPTFTRHTVPPPIASPAQVFEQTLQNLFPDTSPFPIVRRLIVVPDEVPRSPSPRPSPRKSPGPNHAFRPEPGKGKAAEEGVSYAPLDGADGWVGRLLGEVIGDLFGELGEMATALETPTGLKTLSSTLLPSLTSTLPRPPDFRPSSEKQSIDGPSRSSTTTPVGIPTSQSMEHLSGMGISLNRSLTPGGRPTSVGPPSLPPLQTHSLSTSPAPAPPSSASSNPFRRSTALTSPFSRSTSVQSIASNTSAQSVSTASGPNVKHTNAPLSGVAGGRLLKLLGDMYLLAGMYGDAIKCYDDGAERCRAVGDVLWEAGAREGRAVAGIGEAWEFRDGSNMAQAFPSSPIPVEILTHFLSALACIARSPLPFPPTIFSPSPQAVSGSLSFPSGPPAPSSSAPIVIGTGEGLLAYLYSTLSLRISHFLLIIWAASGWGSIALSCLMSHHLPRTFPFPLSDEDAQDPLLHRSRRRALAHLGHKSQITRQSIFAHLEAALGPVHRAMSKTEQLQLHVEAVWLARWLDTPRKEVSYARQVVKRCAAMIVEGREEARRMGTGGFSHQSRRTSNSAPTTALSDASVGLGLGMAVQTATTQNVAVRRKESTDGNAGVIRLFERICEVLGVRLLALFEPSDLPNGTLSGQAVTTASDDIPSEQSRFGWPELQVEMMKEGIAIAEALPDQVAIIRLCLSALHDLHPFLNGASQAHLAKMYPQALATTRRRGIDFGGVPWWLPHRVVLSLEIASLAPNRIPQEHALSEIVPVEGKKDPFLYNPRLKAADSAKTLLVVNEQIEVFVTVKNPFLFDLDIADLSILSSGVPLITSPLPLTLPAQSVQTVRVTGVANEPGTMHIRGIALRLHDGSHTEILLPMIDEVERTKRDKRRSRMSAELGKTKRHGLEARQSLISDGTIASRGRKQSVSAPSRWLECRVIEEQPVLGIRSTSLTHGTVMLYHGESSTIRLTLENSSSVPINFLKLSFDDSTKREAQVALAEGELSPEQAYEVDWDQINRPVFAWDTQEDVDIPPNGRMTVQVRCLGKVGCTDGTIRIDYGHLADPSGGVDGQKSFFTRQIHFPVLFTVYHTLETHSLDITRLLPSAESPAVERKPVPNGSLTPVPSHSSRRGSAAAAAEDELIRVLQSESDDAHCLIGLDIRNVYGVPFEVTIQRTVDELATTRLVPPGATERLIMPLPRCLIPPADLDKPIPTLSERQYVVQKAKRTPVEERRYREAFWYREQLLQALSATWVEPGSRRSGVLSLRHLGLSRDMLDVLRTDDLDIRLEMQGEAVPGEMADIVLTVVNRMERPFRPFVRIEPLPSSSTETSWASKRPAPPAANKRQSTQPPVPTKNIIIDGLLSAPLPLLQPGKEASHAVSLVFLANGTFAFRAAVEEISLPSDGSTDSEEESRIRFSPLLKVNVAQAKS